MRVNSTTQAKRGELAFGGFLLTAFPDLFTWRLLTLIA